MPADTTAAIIATALGGGGVLAAIVKWFTDRANRKEDEERQDRRAFQAELTALRTEVRTLAAENAALKVQINGLTANVEHLKGQEEEVERLRGILLLHRIDPASGERIPGR